MRQTSAHAPAGLSAEFGEERKLTWALIAVTLIGAALRLGLLDSQSLWSDEYTWVRIASERTYAEIVFHPEGWAPLYGLLSRTILLVFGGADAVTRLPSALGGIAAIPVAYAVFRRVQASGVVALVAAALLAVHPLAVWYSMEHGVYSLLMLTALVATLIFLRLLDAPTPAHRIGFGVAAFVGVGLHYFFVFFLLSLGFIALWDMIVARQRRLSWLWTAGAVAVAVLAIAPALMGDLARQTGMDDRFSVSINAVLLAPGYTVLAFTGGMSLGPGPREVHTALEAGLGVTSVLRRYVVELTLAVLAFMVPALIALTGKWDRGRVISFVLMVGPPVLALLGSLVLFSFRPRYALVALPFFLLWAASSLQGRFRHVAIGGIALLFAVQIYALAQINDPRYVREDYRSAAAFIEKTDPGVPVLPLGPVTIARYVAPATPVHELQRHVSFDVDAMEEEILRLTADTGRLWLVSSRTWIIKDRVEIRAFLDRHFDRAESAAFPGVEVVRLIRKDL